MSLTSTGMRGLSVFISDLRNCRTREEEEKRVNKELANIRAKFKGTNLNGYDKKKYVCKLLYMYLLGWEVDFGHVEAVNLITSNKYSEKQIGYLAVTLLLTENSELVRLVINSMRKDLEDFHEVNNCLALQAIANLGGREVAESLIQDVFRLLVAGNSPNFVKKKAALCLLRLYRKHPDVVPIAEWAEKICSVLEDFDVGVVTSVCSLITTLVQASPDHFKAVVPRAVHKLAKIVLEKEYTPDNVYYSVPVPWLQVKLIRLLMYYPPPDEKAVRDKLNLCLQAIFTVSNDVPKNVQQNNAVNAVLLDAIDLVIHIDPDSEMVLQATNLLCRYLSSKETNMRYLGLETMTRLTTFPQCLDVIKKHQETILQSLKDKDVSVRRRALDLLYSMCDTTNSKIIVTELLDQLPVADFAMKEDMVLKIAILAEKFATEPSWYVDVLLKLISAAGDHVSNEVWYRIIQIVTNNDSLHAYTAKQLITLVKQPIVNEILVKICAYLLGEYGDMIANEPGCSPIEQFNAVHSKFGICTQSTKAVLLTAYAKFINLFPEIKPEALAVLNQHRNVLDSELQQRACEYVALATMPSDELLQTVFEQIPPFPDRESALIQRLKKQTESEERRPPRGSNAPEPSRAALQVTPVQDRQSSAIDDLLGLNGGSPIEAVSKEKIEGWYNNLVLNPSGVLYEDTLLQIGFKSEYQGTTGKFALYFGNKTQGVLNQLSVIMQPAQGVQIAATSSPHASIAPMSQVFQSYSVSCMSPFSQPSFVTVNLVSPGGQKSISDLKIPVVGTKFSDPVSFTGDDFMAKWKQIGGGPRESQEVFKVAQFTPASGVKTIFEKLKIGVLEGVDPNPANVTGATVLNTQTGGRVGNLVRIETNAAQSMYRVTVRGTNDVYVTGLKDSIKQLLSSAVQLQ